MLGSNRRAILCVQNANRRAGLKMDSLRLNGLSQPKNFARAIARGPLRGPLAGAYAKFFWLSQTSSIVTPRHDLSWTTDMVTNHVWLQVRHGYNDNI